VQHLERRLLDLPHVRRLTLWKGDDVDRLGVCTFTLDGMDHALTAAALSAEYAVGVRHGCFCAHPYITHLLGIGFEQAHVVRERLRRGQHDGIPGAVRASFGLGTTIEDIDRLVTGLRLLSDQGPRLTYTQDPRTGDFHPVDDKRTLPTLAFLPSLEGGAAGPGCGQY
jgi:selenocysteine lyase/cysteine desulfurase